MVLSICRIGRTVHTDDRTVRESTHKNGDKALLHFDGGIVRASRAATAIARNGMFGARVICQSGCEDDRERYETVHARVRCAMFEPKFVESG